MESKGKIVLITGGAQGLGRNLAEHFYKKGYSIIILDIQSFEDLSESFKEIIEDYYEIDLSDLSLLNQTIDELLVKHKKIDVLLNNASLRIFKDFVDFTESEIERYINVNLRAPLLLIKKIVPIMKQNGYGRVINISSKSAFWGYQKGSLYCSTKSALTRFTEAFGRELDVKKHNVTVNAICPDSFSTTDSRRLKGYRSITRIITNSIDDILLSQRNAEIIPILLPQNKLIQIIRDAKKNLFLLSKY